MRTLPHAAFKILVLLAAQFTGRNNGTMAMTELYAREFGFTSRDTIYRSLRELVDRGLTLQTRRGFKSKTHFALYALNWRPIQNRDGQPLGTPEAATRSWETWTPAGFPTTGNDPKGERTRNPKNLQTDHRESSIPTTGNDGAEYVPISASKGQKSFPTTGNTLRISEGDERGADERTRARLPSLDVGSGFTSDADRVRKMAAADPSLTVFELAKVLHLDPEAVQRYRDGAI